MWARGSAREPVVLKRDPTEVTAEVTIAGSASGILLGGNLDAIRTQAGAGLPNLRGAILFLEHQKGTGLGEVDRALTQLMRSGGLNDVAGVVLGQFINFEPASGWSIVDVLRDRLGRCGVPVLGGIPAGRSPHPPTIPLGTRASFDTAEGVLTVEPAVR
jgi:muramoyltetrapeptide carboxypeptidase